nr:MAG TPA: hypothetical protein [Caudoviricetes sp.]
MTRYRKRVTMIIVGVGKVLYPAHSERLCDIYVSYFD